MNIMDHDDRERPVDPRHIRLSPLKEDDVTDILRLEHACFIDPWERLAFEREAHNDISRSVVARDAEKRLVGYAIYWAAGPEYHLLNLAVAPWCRCRGIGRLLMRRLFHDARRDRAELIALEVRRSNETAKALYVDFGFVTVGMRPHYYKNGEDAEVMLARIER